MNVANVIDRHLPKDPQAQFSHGKILSLLIAARLYSPVALCNVAAWAEQSGADILWGMPIEKMNDDRFGRSLDAFFTQRHSILASVALHVAQQFHVNCTTIRLTSCFTASMSPANLVESLGTVRARSARMPIFPRRISPRAAA
jgi:hypothetical protein